MPGPPMQTSVTGPPVMRLSAEAGTEYATDLAALSAQKHYGLLSISERVALLGGVMRIDSPPGGGVILQIEIPTPYPSA